MFVKLEKSALHRTTHIAARVFFSKEESDETETGGEYPHTLLMLADMLIKPLQEELFREYVPRYSDAFVL